MKKYLLLLGAVFMAANVSAQEEKDLYNSGGGVCYKLNPEDKTATASSFYRMHKGEYTNKDCYSGNIVIPATLDNGYTVTAIGDECFNVCDQLTSVTMPNTIKTIGKYGFSYCNQLTSITIPASVEKIEDCCFHECRGIETLTIEDGDSPLTLGNSSFTTGTVFYELRGLKTVYVGRNIEGDRPAFIDCTSITSMKFGEKVTSLQKYMCKNASGLEELTLSPSLEEIPEEAFYYCKALRTIAIGNNTNVIGDNAFTLCNLPGINLENVKLTSIGRYAFSANYNATFLKLPETLTSIGDNAFASCRALEEVTSNAVTPPTCGGRDLFSFVNTKDCKLIVPDASVEDYKSAFVWKDFFNIASGINDVQPEKDSITDYYTVDGLHSSSARKGLNIIRTKDGKTRKIIR